MCLDALVICGECWFVVFIHISIYYYEKFNITPIILIFQNSLERECDSWAMTSAAGHGYNYTDIAQQGHLLGMHLYCVNT